MIELLTLAGALSLGSVAFYIFWIGFIVSTLVLTGFADRELYGWASVVFILVFVSLGLGGVFNLYKFAVTHPGLLIEYIVGYVLLGMCWGTFKWWRYCKKKRAQYDREKAAFLKHNGVTEFTPALRVAWTLKFRDFSHFGPVMPQASENKEKIINWMYLWPFSVLGYVFSDFVIRLWANLYERMGSIFRAISETVWKSTVNDLASEADIALVKSKLEGRS